MQDIAENKKATAAYELGDEIIDMQLNLERAELVLNIVADEYFRRLNPKEDDGRFAILYKFDRQRIFIEIIVDYLFLIRKELKALAELNAEVIKDKMRRKPA